MHSWYAPAQSGDLLRPIITGTIGCYYRNSPGRPVRCNLRDPVVHISQRVAHILRLDWMFPLYRRLSDHCTKRTYRAIRQHHKRVSKALPLRWLHCVRVSDHSNRPSHHILLCSKVRYYVSALPYQLSRIISTTWLDMARRSVFCTLCRMTFTDP